MTLYMYTCNMVYPGDLTILRVVVYTVPIYLAVFEDSYMLMTCFAVVRTLL